MIAQLPADNLPSALPDPTEIAALQRETRRRIDMSRGAMRIAVGAACLLCAALFLQPWWEVDEVLALELIPVIILPIGAAAQYFIQRRRKRQGLPQVSLRGTHVSVRHGLTVAVGWLLAAVAGGIAMILVTDNLPDWLRHDSVMILLAGFVCAVLCWRAYRLSLWEHLLNGVGLLIFLIVFTFATTTYHYLGFPCLVLGLTELLVGISLHRRWCAWIASLPSDDAGAAAPATATTGHENHP